MEIIFENNVSVILIILTGLIFIPLFILQVVKNKTKKNILSVILKFFFIVLLLMVFSSPSIEYFKNSFINKRLFVFIDSTLSMNDGFYRKNISSAKSVTNALLKQIKEKSPVPVSVFYSAQNTFRKKQNLNIYSGLKMDNVFTEFLNVKASAGVIISDFVKTGFNSVNLPSKPFYLLRLNRTNAEVFVKKAAYENGVVIARVVNNYKPSRVMVKVYSGERVVFKKHFYLKRKTNILKFGIASSLIKTDVLKFELSRIKHDRNALNNVFYFKTNKVKKERVYTLFSRPSYDTKFLINFLKNSAGFIVKKVIPGHGQKVSFINNKGYKTVFIGDLWHGNIKSLKNIKKYVSSGGTLVYIHKNSRLNHKVFRPLKDILPFKEASSNFAAQDKAFLKLTAYGMNYDFITFRDKSKAAQAWKNFSSLKPDIINFKPKRNARVLLRYGKIPVILESRYGRGRVFSVLISPLWKMDFISLGYGLKTYYLSIFYNDLTSLSSKKTRKPVFIENKIFRSGETVKITARPDLERVLLRRKKLIVLKSGNLIRDLYFKRKNGKAVCEINISKPGAYSLYFKGQNKKLEGFYVNYPVSELNYGKKPLILASRLMRNKNVKSVFRKEFMKALKGFRKIKITEKKKKTLPFNSLLLSGLIVLSLILGAWYFRPE